MITIDIWIRNQEIIDRFEDLGIGNKGDSYQLVKFNFKESAFLGFWVDVDEDSDTGSLDICIYLNGITLRTPYTKEKEKMFIEILNKKHE